MPTKSDSDNYFNYFTEIEEHFQRRRGTALLLSTLDWALIETWKDVGIPLAAVLRGIDAAFDRYQARPRKTRKINGLAWCAQEVLAAAEEIKDAAEGAARAEKPDSGFTPSAVAGYLVRQASQLEARLESGALAGMAQAVISDSARALRQLAGGLAEAKSAPMEELERRLTVMEEKIFAALLTTTPDEVLVELRAQADHELAPYRRKMMAAQIEQLHRQLLHKRLLERCRLPRLSLFYM